MQDDSMMCSDVAPPGPPSGEAGGPTGAGVPTPPGEQLQPPSPEAEPPGALRAVLMPHEDIAPGSIEVHPFAETSPGRRAPCTSRIA